MKKGDTPKIVILPEGEIKNIPTDKEISQKVNIN